MLIKFTWHKRQFPEDVKYTGHEGNAFASDSCYFHVTQTLSSCCFDLCIRKPWICEPLGEKESKTVVSLFG